jgi:hypothetical protein
MPSLAALITILAFSLNVFGPPRKDLPDDSDWWTLVVSRGAVLGEPKGERPPVGNFTIAGIDLGPGSFNDVIPKFGTATVVMRGEQTESREQLCYKSSDGKTRLIFERGEAGEAFYLVGEGPDWNGSSRCVESPLVTSTIATASGLKLGMTPIEVQGVLGDPCANIPGKSEWLWTGQFVLTVDELTRIRKREPNIEIKDSEVAAVRHNLSAVIEVTYTNGRSSEIGAWYSFDDSTRFEE